MRLSCLTLHEPAKLDFKTLRLSSSKTFGWCIPGVSTVAKWLAFSHRHPPCFLLGPSHCLSMYKWPSLNGGSAKTITDSPPFNTVCSYPCASAFPFFIHKHHELTPWLQNKAKQILKALFYILSSAPGNLTPAKSSTEQSASVIASLPSTQLTFSCPLPSLFI